MAPLVPHWTQPSHPECLKVVPSEDPENFTTLSTSLVDLPANAVFARFTSPPITPATKAYSTVQTSADTHIELNSDLVYINHSCNPSLIFDIGNMEIRTTREIKVGDELTFFYPSTEWDMAQPFECFCGESCCKGLINGAGKMKKTDLEGMWLNAWLREACEKKWAEEEGLLQNATAVATKRLSQIANAIKGVTDAAFADGKPEQPAGAQRQGASARELAGEMGGDTQ
ncbi:hypothetical protein FPQ18DRAFT_103778 [Pyronema domesticum]|uniref:Similar to Histone-lysine N-methyltransferase, H3 lysine-36 specific acc. no. Q2H988 n=1 Tax=Pyronema omphalodes (strain CBS 100304) TaxID=1076935 RepID=U4LSA0_PYROM|nr:hypothetical protein FPQ18DRAFT_103778 [Pyronema domesticum]CCX30186.1 Similar to Histone-lysine N-methyltransferase, H3 lysine-36 specific; acc. no. Q2H988 [Pyronema omphalodes CBS 100304]